MESQYFMFFVDIEWLKIRTEGAIEITLYRNSEFIFSKFS